MKITLETHNQNVHKISKKELFQKLKRTTNEFIVT